MTHADHTEAIPNPQRRHRCPMASDGAAHGLSASLSHVPHMAWTRGMRMNGGWRRNGELKLGDVPTLQRKTWQHITISNLIDDYLKAYPSLNYNNVVSLRQFSRDAICSKSLLDFTKQDVHRFVERKLQESWKPPGAKGEAKPLSPRTVRRQLNIIQRVFQHAIDFREGYASLPNHFRGIRIVRQHWRQEGTSIGGRRIRTDIGGV